MVLLLVILAWALILSLVVGMCLMASVGERQQPGRAVLPGWEESEPELLVSRLSVEDAGAPVEVSGAVARSAA